MANKARVTTTTITTTTSHAIGMLSLLLLTVLLMGITLPATTAMNMDHGVVAAAAPSAGNAAGGGAIAPSGESGGGGGGGLKLSQIDGKSLFRSLRASSCSVDCSAAEPEQVCGTDGVTYASRCELQRAKQCDGKQGVQGARVKVRSKGPCPGDTPVVSKCFAEREEARKVALRQSSDVLIPSCNPDGTYSDVQCHTATSYCWCVTKEGRHVPGTSLLERRPRCKGRRRKRKGGRNNKKKKKRKASCTNKERQSFNTDLVNVFREEYDRMSARKEGDSSPSLGAAGADEDSLEKKIVVWKFSQLDTNADDELSFKEIRSFRRMVKKLIKPRRCAKRFHRYCDKDNNRRIQKKEWTLCLWVDIKNGQTTHTPPDKSRYDPLLRPLPPALQSPSGLSPQSSRPAYSGHQNMTESSKRSCPEQRLAAQQHAKEEPSANVYVPRCQENGLWRQAQCHEATQYCWCVAEDSGMPLPGIATYQVEPNCSIRDDRQMKGVAFPGCPFEQKRRFIVDLIADMTEEMNQSKVTPQQLSASEMDQLDVREQVARWKLRSLDKNSNDMLERQEWRDLRKTLKKNKNYPRKCRRQFLRYCDENDDKTLSMEEWRDCLGLNHNLFNSLPRDPNRFGKRNPFRKYLQDYDSDQGSDQGYLQDYESDN